jgi:uncharacterized integral membrane protein (TIGR00698 family)
VTSADPPQVRAGFAELVPGLALAALVAAAALALAEVPWVRDALHWSALLLVILLGVAWRSFLPVPAAAEPGLRTAQRTVLRVAVAGLGFRLSLRELVEVGAPALVVVVVGTGTALAFGWWVARRLGVPRELGLLIGVGGAICGASAVVAADSVVRGERRDAAVAVGVCTLLGTLGIVLYPLLYPALAADEFVYGVWSGASLHETAQALAAAFAVGTEAGRVASVVKLARIALLAPVVLGLAWSLRRQHERAGRPRVALVPWFLVAFVAFVALASTGWIPAAWLAGIVKADFVLLCVGMAGVGLETRFSDLRDAGLRPIAAGAAQWVVLAAVTLALATWLCA